MAAPPLTGNWASVNANANQFSGALKWGTGINPVHSIYGEGSPLRGTGREPGPTESDFEPEGVPPELINPERYGYCMEDVLPLGHYPDSPPPVGEETSVIRDDIEMYPPWGQVHPSSGTVFRTISAGAEVYRHTPVSFPTETVSEGWENKTTLYVGDAETSDPSQYEMQTSMRQVNPPEGRNNALAVARGTDDPRDNIVTRLTGMKRKPWSEGERLQDMFPYQQDMKVRPFWYRTAGTGFEENMRVNDMYVSDPIQRDPPPDPFLGDLETSADVYRNEEYGYTTEDTGY
jgi:hypothetical protein